MVGEFYARFSAGGGDGMGDGRDRGGLDGGIRGWNQGGKEARGMGLVSGAELGFGLTGTG
jgi:hypothetical protein